MKHNNESFVQQEKVKQVAYFDATYPDRLRFQGASYRLMPEQSTLNLAPEIRDIAARYFQSKNITWHTHSNHALSSQVCCLNFLMPLCQQPGRLAKLVGHALGIAPPEMLTPNGPIRADLELALTDFFYEPFYQLLRQQMFAFQMQIAQVNGASRVRVLHISPSGNTALHRVTSPALQHFGDDAFKVFQHVLIQPDQFVSRNTETLFRPLIDAPNADDSWKSYLVNRYRFLSAV